MDIRSMIEVTERLNEQIPVQEAFMGNLLDYIKWRGLIRSRTGSTHLLAFRS